MSLRDRFGGLEQARELPEPDAVPARSAVSRFAGIAPVGVEPSAPAPVADPFAAPPDAPISLELDAPDASPDGTRRCMQCAFANSRYASSCGGCGGPLDHAAQRRFDEARALDARKRQAEADAALATARAARTAADDELRQQVAETKLAEVMTKVDAIAVAHGASPRRTSARAPVVVEVEPAVARIEPEAPDPRFPTAANPRPWAGTALAEATRVGSLARANRGERLGLMIAAGFAAVAVVVAAGWPGLIVAGLLGIFIASLLARWAES